MIAFGFGVKKPELCILGEHSAFNLINDTTDDGERWPITMELEKAYEAAMRERFEFNDVT